MTTFNHGDSVQVAGYPGIAFTVLGPETVTELNPEAFRCPECDGAGTIDREPDEPDEADFDEIETGALLVTMVGDDRVFAYDPDELTPLADSDYCPECGQVGCNHG